MKTIKKASLLFASLALVLGAGLVGNSDTKEVKAEESVIYKVASTTSVTTSGVAPDGSTATLTNTFGTASQITKNNSQTLTLKGFAGNKITGITLSMRSNKSAGAGTFKATAGAIELASINSATSFNKWFNNNAYSATYVDVNVKLSNTNYIIQDNEDVTIVIAATTNSLYCQSYKIFYESSSASLDPMTSITIENDFNTKSYKQNSQWDVDGLVVKAVYESGKKKELANSDINWSFNKKPSDFEPGTGYSITVTALYKTFSANKIIEGIEIIESPRVYSFNSMKGFDTWESGYEQHVDYLTYPGLKIVLEKANKNSNTITDVPVTKGNDVKIIVTDNTSISAAAFTFKQWGSKAQTVRLYTSTDAGQTYSSSSLASSTNFTIPETTLPENTNALKITFSSQSNQIGLVDFQLRKGKDTVENFVSNWKTFRTNGGNDGICYYLTETNREALEIMLARHDAFDVSDKTTIDAATDVEGVTIGETITYLKNVLAGSTKTDGNYGIKTDSGVVITSNNSYDKTSLIALFAILGIVTISGYYIIEKKKFSK